MYIHIKITQYHYLVRIFLQMDCDETLHVVWVCPGEGFGTIGTSGLKKSRPEAPFALRVCINVGISISNQFSSDAISSFGISLISSL